MADINQVVLSGRLTRDSELRYTESGIAVCKFSIAVNRKKKEGDTWKDEPNFFDVVLWGRQGEALNQYLVKGKQVGVAGELRQDRWQQDGQNRSKVEVVANTLQLFGGGNSNGEGRDNTRQNQSRETPSAPTYSGRESDDDFTDDIPF